MNPIIIKEPDYFARLHYRLRARRPIWVVYRPFTKEYPGRWVARMHIVHPEARPTRFVMAHDTLDELRDLLPPGLSRRLRHPNDVPEIEEVWL